MLLKRSLYIYKYITKTTNLIYNLFSDEKKKRALIETRTKRKL